MNFKNMYLFLVLIFLTPQLYSMTYLRTFYQKYISPTITQYWPFTEKQLIQRAIRESIISEQLRKEKIKKTIKIHPSRVIVVQQKGVECGYWAVLNSIILYRALKNNIPLGLVFEQMKTEKIMRAEMSKSTAKTHCARTLDEGHIETLLQHYKIDQPFGSGKIYSIISQSISPDPAQAIIKQPFLKNVIHRLKYTPGNIHIFLLRSGDPYGLSLGHWISVVAFNNGSEIKLFVMDSLRPHNPNPVWKSLARLINHV